MHFKMNNHVNYQDEHAHAQKNKNAHDHQVKIHDDTDQHANANTHSQDEPDRHYLLLSSESGHRQVKKKTHKIFLSEE